jgi:hypothetical protein
MLKRTPNLDKVVDSIDFYELRLAMMDLLDILDDAIPAGETTEAFAVYLPELLSKMTVAAAKDGLGSHPSVDRFIPCKN